MSDAEIFSHDPMTGITAYFEDLEADGFKMHYVQDVEAILDRNKAKQNLGRSYYARSDTKGDLDMWHVASIPIVVQMKWMTEKGVDVWNEDHVDAVAKLLNDPEWRYLKTADIII